MKALNPQSQAARRPGSAVIPLQCRVWRRLNHSAVAPYPARDSQDGNPHFGAHDWESHLHGIAIDRPNPDVCFCGPTSPSPQGPQKNAEPSRPTVHVSPMAVTDREARRSRNRGVRHHWLRAKRLSHTLGETDALCLLHHSKNQGFLPSSATDRIRALVAIRDRFRQTWLTSAALRADAVILQEIRRLKNIQKK